uniref:tail fiber/spike domain-containing protein n=1 Tax=Escherichia coli TaxID=562 RepID=UPI003855B02C
MSSGCGDVLSLADLQTAKKHQIFEAEVITGKSCGVATGADIDYATNQVTGQTQKTLPAVLRDAGFSPVSWNFSTGGTLTVNDRDKVVYDTVSKTWYSYAGTLPVVVPASFNPVGNANWKPQTDPNLRNDLASSTAGLGASLVSFSNGNTVETLSDAEGAKNIGSGERSLLARNNDIKHSGDFSTLQAAVDASLTKNDLIVSPGEYTEAITLGSKQIKGVGGAAILKPSANYANTVQVNLSTPHWQFRHSGGFAVDGTGTTGAVGISFDPSDQY